MLQKITEHVYAFPGRRFDCYSYLLIEDIPLLVDPGTGMFFSKLANDLNSIGYPPNKIGAIVNTHCHYDHCGAGYLFSCPSYAREPDLTAIRNGNEMTIASTFGMEFIPVKAELIPDEFHSWRVYSTPGHTPGSISLYKELDGIKVLISGDALFPGGVGRTDLPGGDESALKKTLEFLDSLEYDVLLSGHGIGGKQSKPF